MNIEDIRLTTEELSNALDKAFKNDNIANPANIALFSIECANDATDKAIKKIRERLDMELDSGENSPTICRNIHYFTKELYLMEKADRR